MTTKFRAEPRYWLLIVALFIAIYASYKLIVPYIGPLVLAFILSLLCYPVHVRIKNRMKNYPNLAAGISCTLLTGVILIPAALVILAMIHQGATFAQDSYTWLSQDGARQITQHPYTQRALELINEWVPGQSIATKDIIENVSAFSADFGKVLVNASTAFLGNISLVAFNFVLLIFVLFFMLRDYDKMIANLFVIIPLARSQKEALFGEVKKVAKSAVLGSFLTAIAQGFIGGIAMSLAGLPGLFWGMMMGFASFIPVVGTALIWVPASLYLLMIGDWQWAIFLSLFGVFVVGSVDNFLRPILMQGSSNMSTLLIFLSLMGGLQLFGLIGLLYGPIIFAITLVLFRLYTSEFRLFLEHQDKS